MRGTVGAWVRGWTLSRATSAPVAVRGGWRVEVGLHGHRRRFVLHEHDEGMLARLGVDHGAPGTWIKMAGDPDALRAALPHGWEMSETGHLMTTTYGAGKDVADPPSYTARVEVSGPVTKAVMLDGDGQIAASAKLAVAGAFGMVDQVETAPEHRRRGLGSAVMRKLAAHAFDAGARIGVLVATDDGRDLYRTLGWTVRSPFAVAYVPEP